MNHQDTIRVLIVDDQALMRAGFRALLDAEDGIEVIGEAADGRQGWNWPATTSRTWPSSTYRCL